MEKLVAPFDREFKELLKTINVQSILDIVLLEKSSIEVFFCQSWSQIQLSEWKEMLTAGVEIRQHQHQQQL